jgi:hypothetical protein
VAALAARVQGGREVAATVTFGSGGKEVAGGRWRPVREGEREVAAGEGGRRTGGAGGAAVASAGVEEREGRWRRRRIRCRGGGGVGWGGGAGGEVAAPGAGGRKSEARGSGPGRAVGQI